VKSSESYRAAGVDISAGDEAKRRIAALAKKTFTSGVVSDIGAFGGVFRFPEGSRNLLLASADGVGTKLKVASAMGVFNTVGRDLVNHCVNDLLTLNAAPLFFLDYIGHSDMTAERIAELVEGLSTSCVENGLALIGGETAQLPGIYSPGDFDLAGFIVGTATDETYIDGGAIRPGDRLVALPSNGLMTNGYSLARRVLLDSGRFAPDDRPELLGGQSVGEALLAVHPSFLGRVKSLLQNNIEISGMAHITGGGIAGNLIRVLPKGCRALVEVSQIPIPPIFELIRSTGDIPRGEMFEVFNMGAGFILALRPNDLPMAFELAAIPCGEIVSGERSVEIGGLR